MEYEFVHDPITGEARALFSLDHEVIGPWIEVELGHDAAKMKQLLTVIDNIENDSNQEVSITGSEYSITLTCNDISIQTNASINDNVSTSNGNLPEMLTDEHINLDQYEQAACGLEDFRALLLSWKQFTNGLH
jgi:hypothetical protein